MIFSYFLKSVKTGEQCCLMKELERHDFFAMASNLSCFGVCRPGGSSSPFAFVVFVVGVEVRSVSVSLVVLPSSGVLLLVDPVDGEAERSVTVTFVQ